MDPPATPEKQAKEFAFKPALLLGRSHYRLGRDALVCSDQHGVEKWRLGWMDITRAAFVEHKVKGSRIRRLDLMTDTGADTQSVSYTGGIGNPAADPDGVAQLDLIVAILERLAVHRPGFQISIGEYGRSRVAIFAIGVASIVGAAGLMALVLATGVSHDRLGAVAVPVLMLVLLGAGLAYAHAPWRELPQLPALDFAAALRLIAHPETETV